MKEIKEYEKELIEKIEKESWTELNIVVREAIKLWYGQWYGQWCIDTTLQSLTIKAEKTTTRI